MTKRLDHLNAMQEVKYQQLPEKFRTPNCAKTQQILADAFSSKPILKAKFLENRFQEDCELEWINNLRLEGKAKKSTKIRRLTRSNPTLSPPPMANVQRIPVVITPRVPEPIIIDDEETPVAEISKGSENEFQVYTAQLKAMEKQIQAVQKKQVMQGLKASAAKHKLQHVKSDLACLMRKMKKLTPLIPRSRKHSRPQPRRPSRSSRRSPNQNQRLRALRQQRINKNRVMAINQAASQRRWKKGKPQKQGRKKSD